MMMMMIMMMNVESNNDMNNGFRILQVCFFKVYCLLLQTWRHHLMGG